MARKSRVHFEGGVYHVISRGNQGHGIFRDDKGRQCYVDLLKESGRQFVKRSIGAQHWGQVLQSYTCDNARRDPVSHATP